MKLIGVAAGACLFFATSVVVARDGDLSGGAATAAIDQQLIDQEVAPIRSQAALRQYLRVMPAKSPLRLLSASSRERFLGSLVFSKKGLASYSYEELAAHLTAFEAYKVLALFGQQSSVKVIPGLRQPDELSRAIMLSADARGSSSPASGGVSPDQSTTPNIPNYGCVRRATCGQEEGKVCIAANC